MNGIIKFISSENNQGNEKTELTINPNVTNQQNFNNIQTDGSQIKKNILSENVNPQNKPKADFSSLYILMRKATRLLNLFDNKVKLVTNKIKDKE